MVLKRVCIVLLIASLAMGVGIVRGDPVPNPENGHYYELVYDDLINWSEALIAADAMTLGGDLCHGYLATATSGGENDFIVATFGTGPLSNKWLGAIQYEEDSATPNDGWHWGTGEAWIYTNWNDGEPNNINYGADGYEDALTYWTNGRWNDAPDTWRYGNGGFVVEYDCMQVMIDIKPGSDPNSINLKSRGVVPVAILTTADFDAATVDPEMVTLEGIAPIKWEMCDVPEVWDEVLMTYVGDGDMDLVLFFSTQDLATVLTGASTEATLMGQTFAGGNVHGIDAVRIVKG